MTIARYLFLENIISDLYVLNELINNIDEPAEELVQEYNYKVFLLRILLI